MRTVFGEFGSILVLWILGSRTGGGTQMNCMRIKKNNIDREHICCAMSGMQSHAKKEWLRQRFSEGLSFTEAKREASALSSIFRLRTHRCPSTRKARITYFTSALYTTFFRFCQPHRNFGLKSITDFLVFISFIFRRNQSRYRLICSLIRKRTN